MFCRFVLSIFTVVGILAVFGCSTTDIEAVSTADFAQTEVVDNMDAAKLSAGDTVEVSVEVDGRMEVSRHRAILDHFGVITLPLVGDVKVGDLTMDKARKSITDTYSTYFVNTPVVMLSTVQDLDGGGLGFVTVTGRVGTPGRISIMSASGMKLTEAIQAAGGFGTSAKRSDVRVSRVDGHGQKVQVSVDYNKIGKRGSAEADLTLRDGDIVYVPERLF